MNFGAAVPEFRRKAYYLMSIHEHLPPQVRRELKEVGWTKGLELAKLASRDRHQKAGEKTLPVTTSSAKARDLYEKAMSCNASTSETQTSRTIPWLGRIRISRKHGCCFWCRA